MLSASQTFELVLTSEDKSAEMCKVFRMEHGCDRSAAVQDGGLGCTHLKTGLVLVVGRD